MQTRLEKVIDPSGGANQTRVRAYNERLILSLVRRHGNLPKAEIARRSGLSAQTVSVIMRALETDGLLLRGEPQRGKVGQPSIPMSLNPEGAFSFGLKIGRRSADLILVDFLGRERKSLHKTYAYPLPKDVLKFAATGIESFRNSLSDEHRQRITGIGVATPFELWNWAEQVGAPQAEMDSWRSFDMRAELEAASDLPTFIRNDASAACSAELAFGRGSELIDFVYFFVGTFIGGGIVLNHALYPGRIGNAGAFGPMPVIDGAGKAATLIDSASIFTLETMLKEAGIDPSPLWLEPYDWSKLGDVLDEWIANMAKHLAFAILTTCSVIDFEAVVIDGGFPEDVRAQLVDATQSEFRELDLRGITEPKIFEGMVGSGARELGGASLPLFARYLLDQSVVFKGG